MSYITLYDRVLVKRNKAEEVSKGGIILSQRGQEKAFEGIVVSTGSGRLLKDGRIRELIVKAGDKILFAKYTGAEFKINGEDHLILKEDDILAVIE